VESYICISYLGISSKLLTCIFNCQLDISA
jgi:hypothetical protein